MQTHSNLVPIEAGAERARMDLRWITLDPEPIEANRIRINLDAERSPPISSGAGFIACRSGVIPTEASLVWKRSLLIRPGSSSIRSRSVSIWPRSECVRRGVRRRDETKKGSAREARSRDETSTTSRSAKTFQRIPVRVPPGTPDSAPRWEQACAPGPGTAALRTPPASRWWCRSAP